jgi:signal peptidase I
MVPASRRTVADSGAARRASMERGMSANHVTAAPPRRRGAPSQQRRGRARLLLDAFAGAALAVLLHAFVLQVSVVRGSSMEPCLHDGDRLVVDRLSYSLAEVRRGDVVVLRNPRNRAVDFVKRIAALPGDLVQMRDGTLLVNGVPDDTFGCIHDRDDLARFEVPQGHFFVLGDNRPVSCDSRDFGLVAERLLRGRVRARFWPLQAATVF